MMGTVICIQSIRELPVGVRQRLEYMKITPEQITEAKSISIKLNIN
jgi:hypothetical protein